MDPAAARRVYETIAGALSLAQRQVPACIGHTLPRQPVDVELAERFRRTQVLRRSAPPLVTDPETRAGEPCPRCGGTRTEQTPDGSLFACMDDRADGRPCGYW